MHQQTGIWGFFYFFRKDTHILTGKTHFTFGTAVTILMTHPTDWKSFLLCLGAGAVGACVSDVDVSTSGSHKGFQRLLLLLAAAVLVIAGLDFFFQAGIWAMIQQRNGLLRSLAGFAIFLALCLYGEHQPHRSFTHSLAGVAMLGTAVFIMLPQAVWYFVCGMTTHILLDLFNRKKVQLLFPFDVGKVCFRLCSADGAVNRLLFWTGFFLLIGESIWAVAAFLHRSGWLPF